MSTPPTNHTDHTSHSPARRSWAEPWKIKMVEPLRMTTPAERQRALEEAGYNTFLLRSDDVYIDLLTDSGTNAMSDRQWAALMMGDEAYAGSRNYYELERVVQDTYGYREFIPTHQGRGAEFILSQIAIKPGQWVPGNMYFTTTRYHQEAAGGRFVDVIVDQAHDASSSFQWKGNCDLAKIQRLIDTSGAASIAYLSLETNVNMAGGQPCSLANIEETCQLCHRHGIKVYLDATRAVENAWYIQQQEPGHANQSIAQIVRRICDLTDGATMSGKKDSLVNIGGFLALNDATLAEEARNLLVCHEGLHTYGGMSGRDMAAMAVGITESVQEDHIRSRIGQVHYLGNKLLAAGIPVVKPLGGHGVYLDAPAFLPHLPRAEYPAQALAAAIYLESGVRTMERGAVSAGRDQQGNELFPRLELVRLTIPRRVYTQAHMDVTAESIIDVYARRDQVPGLRMVHEPSRLRFFQARFEPLPIPVHPSGRATLRLSNPERMPQLRPQR